MDLLHAQALLAIACVVQDVRPSVILKTCRPRQEQVYKGDNRNNSMKTHIFWQPWLWLMAAIVFEVAGTSIMKISHGWELSLGAELGLLCMWACLGISYFSLAKATLRIPVGVAFALWDAVGLVLIVGVSVFYLQESLSLKTSLGLLCVLLGGFLVHKGTDGGESTEEAGK